MMNPTYENVRIHETAIIEPGVEIGSGTAIWDHVHIRHDTEIGEECIIGEKTYIAYDVKIGDRVKINSFVYICTGVTIEDGVMIAAGVVFTNDKFPRAATPDLSQLLTSDPTEETMPTFVRRGTTIGANATIGCGIEIGEFSMIGMGAVVTKNVLPYQLVYGNPSRFYGYVCKCGQYIGDSSDFKTAPANILSCKKCGRKYKPCDDTIQDVEDPK